MSKSPQPTAPRATETESDGFALAVARLSIDKPLRNARLQQVQQHLINNRFLQAERELKDFLARQPDDADALSLMARAQVRQGRPLEALPFLDRCLAAAPGFASARYNRAHLNFQWARQDAALADLDQLLTDEPGNPVFMEMQAQVLETVGRSEEALAIWEQLARAHPRRAESWIRYGHALRALGHPERCIEAYRAAIAAQPTSGRAYWALADLRTFRFDDNDIEAMRAQLKRRDMTPHDHSALQYALGKALEDRGAYEQSFHHYDQGALALRQQIQYDASTLTRGVDDNIRVFTPAFFAQRAEAGCMAPDPIFVLSRPRSGSTLVEQMLSSHSAIEGVGELPFIRNLAKRLGKGRDKEYATGYLQALQELDAASIRALGEEYLASVAPMRKLGRPFFVDKMPANAYFVGLIRTILPRARIIDVRRHPAGCCLSIFKSFTRSGVLRLSELGLFYRDYVRLMAHFDRSQPGLVHRVIYEELVDHPRAVLEAVLGYLGLPFEEGCLRFHDNQRRVVTPSSEQVRRPISRAAVDHWRHYEPWLGPLLESLGSVAEQYPVVPADLQ